MFPTIPAVRALDIERGVVLLDHVPGRPLATSIDADDIDAVRSAAAAVAAWHRGWRGRPTGLRPHTIEREARALARQAEKAGGAIGARAMEAAQRDLEESWPTDTVVHRDLYEDQIILGPRVALIDLDDAAAGPCELDVGNVLAHLMLRDVRRGRDQSVAAAAFLAGYRGVGTIDQGRLDRCTRLSLRRLACIHREERLLSIARASGGD